MCTAIERVLLDGGAARYFPLAAADELAADLQLLHNVFVNDGQGVSKKEVSKEMAVLARVGGGAWLGW